MSQQNDTSFITLIAGAVLAANRRVKMNGTTARSVIYADAGEDFIGVTQHAAASGAKVTIKTRFAPGSFKVTVSADTTNAGASLYGAADGKVSTTVSGEIYFIGLERGTADGAVIEAVAFPVFSSANASGTTATSFQIDNDNTGPKLKNDAGALAVRNAADNAAAALSAAAGTFTGALLSQTTLIAPGFKAGSVAVAADDLVVPVTKALVLKTTGADAEALTLANGTAGQVLAVQLVVDGGGDGTLTPATSTVFGTIVFADAGDTAVLMYVDGTVGWIILGLFGLAAQPAYTLAA